MLTRHTWEARKPSRAQVRGKNSWRALVACWHLLSWIEIWCFAGVFTPDCVTNPSLKWRPLLPALRKITKLFHSVHIPSRTGLVVVLVLSGATQIWAGEKSIEPTLPIKTVHFGFQLTEGTSRALERWRPLIARLNHTASQKGYRYRFTIQPYSIEELRQETKKGNIDILVSDPATFLWAEVNSGARPLLSSAQIWNGRAIDRNGSLIFSRANKTGVHSLEGLRGRKLMAVAPDSYFGWLLAKKTLRAHNINPDKYLSALMFSNGNQRDVVYAVRSGLVDAGVVKSGVLESLAQDGIIKMSEFSVLSKHYNPDYPFVSSTALYPGWVLSARPNLSEEVLSIIIDSLLSASPSSPAVEKTGGMIWLAPQNYESVRKLLIYLRAAPYENYLVAAASRIVHLYRTQIIFGVLMLAASFTFLFFQLKRSLRLLEENRNVLASEERSREFYRSAIEEHTVFCMLKRDGSISHVNRQFCEITNYTPEKLLAQSLTDVLSTAHKEQFKSEILTTIASGNPWSGSLRLVKPDGAKIWTQCTIIPVTKTGSELSEIAVVASDVTQTYVGASTASFHDSLELISDQVIVLDASSLDLLYCNKAAAQHFCTRDNVDGWRGHSISDFITADELEAFQIRRDALVEGPERRIVWEVEAEVPYEISLEYIQCESDCARLVAIYRDLSEKRLAEIAKAEFVATISHELRTPLTSIKGALGLAANGTLGELPPKLKPLVKIANENCNRLATLIDDILDLEKIEAGKMDYAMHLVDLAEIVRKAVESNYFYADRFGVTIRTDIVNGPGGYSVIGDPQRLAQVLDNLLSNAAKFSPKGGEIIVKVSKNQDKVQLSVKDQGSGIPDYAKDSIFEKFSQADSSDTRSKGGTGLGLTIAKMIVTAHEGEIWFDSTEGDGTEFFVRFPYASQQRTITDDEPNNSMVVSSSKTVTNTPNRTSDPDRFRSTTHNFQT